MVHRQVAVGQRLRLNSLARVHDEDRALAGRQGAAHLVVEIHMTGGIDEVEVIHLAIVRLIIQRHRPRLDGDAALLFQLHIVQDLILHIPLGHRLGRFQNPVGQGAFAVVNMGDDAEIADVVLIAHSAPPSLGIVDRLLYHKPLQNTMPAPRRSFYHFV